MRTFWATIWSIPAVLLIVAWLENAWQNLFYWIFFGSALVVSYSIAYLIIRKENQHDKPADR